MLPSLSHSSVESPRRSVLVPLVSAGSGGPSPGTGVVDV